MKKAGIVHDGTQAIPRNKKGRNIRPFNAYAVLLFVKAEFFLQIVDVRSTILEVLVVHDTNLQINVGFDAIYST